MEELLRKKDYVYSIQGLLIGKGDIDQKIVDDIDEFISIVPKLVEDIRACLRKDKIPFFILNMKTAHALLRSVHARYLETYAERLIMAAEFNDLDMCREWIESFIADMLSLSIEMQMAQARAGEEVAKARSQIEMYTETIHNIEAVAELIAIGEFDRAHDMVCDIEALRGNNLTEELLTMISAACSEESVELAKRLKDLYLSRIAALGGSKSDFLKKILVVDDRPDMLRTVSVMLRDDYKVFTVASGKEALNLLKTKSPDLFILDIEMPNMNGFELARAIRAMSDYAETPILFLTGNASREYVVDATLSGGNDFIVKPPKKSSLIARVGKYFMV